MKPNRVASLFRKDSVEEMASALLDSPVQEHPVSTPLQGKVGLTLLHLVLIGFSHHFLDASFADVSAQG